MIDTEKQQEKNYVNMFPAWRKDKQIIKQQQAYIEYLEAELVGVGLELEKLKSEKLEK
jgi:hypothetical protein